MRRAIFNCCRCQLYEQKTTNDLALTAVKTKGIFLRFHGTITDKKSWFPTILLIPFLMFVSSSTTTVHTYPRFTQARPVLGCFGGSWTEEMFIGVTLFLQVH